jgi:hypothetical protein
VMRIVVWETAFVTSGAHSWKSVEVSMTSDLPGTRPVASNESMPSRITGLASSTSVTAMGKGKLVPTFSRSLVARALSW